jgi:hypothetical protein
VINTVLPDASLQLGKLAENVSKAMDKIATREKHINSHYEHLILDYRAMQEKLQGAEQKCAPVDRTPSVGRSGRQTLSCLRRGPPRSSRVLATTEAAVSAMRKNSGECDAACCLLHVALHIVCYMRCVALHFARYMLEPPMVSAMPRTRRT